MPAKHPDLKLPLWGWITIAALTALIALPVYIQYFWRVSGWRACQVFEYLLPRA